MKNITIQILLNGQLMNTLTIKKNQLRHFKDNVMNMYGSFGNVIVK